MKHPFRFSYLFVFLSILCTPISPARGQDVVQRIKNFGRHVLQRPPELLARPATGRDNAIEELAAEIDWLENYVDRYGSIVAKQPDIWGESRLTKYRREVEEVLGDRIDEFQLRDNASIIRSDIADLASIISIGSLANSSVAGYDRQLQSYQDASAAANAQYANALADYQRRLALYEAAMIERGKPAKPDQPNAPTIETSPTPPTPPKPIEFDQINFKPLGVIKPTERYKANSNLEPVIELNQLKRYLDHLNQLRRVNEGDDTSDSPGYALNLVRLPVSIMPGRATRRGYGAEVTVSATPIKSRVLLPDTFRNLVVNDLVDELGLPILRLAESGKLNLAIFIDDRRAESRVLQREILEINPETDFKQSMLRILPLFTEAAGHNTPSTKTQLAILMEYLSQLQTALAGDGDDDIAKNITEFTAYLKYIFSDVIKDESMDPDKARLESYLAQTAAERKSLEERDKQTVSAAASAAGITDAATIAQASKNYNRRSRSLKRSGIALNAAEVQIESVLAASDKQAETRTQVINLKANILKLQDNVQNISRTLQQATFTTTNRNQKSRYPVAPSVKKGVFGDAVLRSIARQLKTSYNGRHIVWNESANYANQIHLIDAKNYLHESIDTAYETLADPLNRQLLIETVEGTHTGRKLSELICNGTVPIVEQVRVSFLRNLQSHGVEKVISNFCWCLTVEMAMLNKRLNEDVHEQGIKKGDCGCKPNCYHMYYLPMPKCSVDAIENVDPDFAAAADEFCRYVQCRWPIHVFTIDPINQEQNVSDASVVRRELSIAAALAFTSGKINLNQLTRFQRQFQEDIATVGLNRTQVGFMHAHDTFGWRFTPRIQTRKPQGNLRAFGESLLGRGADANWREASLEPGMRECTAIVLMPSFVPYCDFDIRTNWFQIDKPTHSDVSMKETMKLSRSVTRMRNARALCAQCEHLYRPGEIGRLLKRVDQLEREIPLQTLRSQIPYENTLGGFELFNNGLTDLGPQLEGWYGAPGIVIGFNTLAEDATTRRANRPPNTTLFLVGDNFSVNETAVIAGGRLVEDAKLISRQVIQITVPDDAQIVDVDNKKYVAIYMATPYGATNHLHVPIVTNGLEAASAASIASLKKELEKKFIDVPVQWTAKPTLDLEVGFCVTNNICQVGGIKHLNPSDKFQLALNAIAAKIGQNMNRPFSLVGVIKSADEKSTYGQPVLIVSNQTFDPATGKITWDANQLFGVDFLNEVMEVATASRFKGENSLKLKLEVYVGFLNNTGHSTPVRIASNLDINVVANERCRTIISTPATPATAPTIAPPATPAGAYFTPAPQPQRNSWNTQPRPEFQLQSFMGAAEQLLRQNEPVFK